MSLKKSCGKLSCRVSAPQKVPSTSYVSLSLFTPFFSCSFFTKTYELYRLTSLSRTQLQKKSFPKKKRRTLRPPPLLLVKKEGLGVGIFRFFLSGGFGACIMQSHPVGQYVLREEGGCKLMGFKCREIMGQFGIKKLNRSLGV